MLNVIYAECRKQTHYAECRYAERRYTECRYAECWCAEYLYAECRYAECRYAECHYPECRYAERHLCRVSQTKPIVPSVVRLNVVMLSVVAQSSTQPFFLNHAWEKRSKLKQLKVVKKR